MEVRDLETTATKPDKGSLGRWWRVMRRRDRTRSVGSNTSKSCVFPGGREEIKVNARAGWESDLAEDKGRNRIRGDTWTG